MFWANFSTTLCDVAESKAVFFLGSLFTVTQLIKWMHIEFGNTDKETRTRKGLLVLFVIANNVTCVLAQEAFNALAEFL